MAIFARGAAKAFNQGTGTLAAGAHILQMGVGRSATGLSITTDKAMRYAAFWSAVRILAESIASLPVSIIRQGAAGRRTVAREHPVHQRLHGVANPQMSAYTFKEVSMVHLTTWGGGYALMVRDGIGRLRELWPLAADRMEVDRVDRPYVARLTDPPMDVPFAAGDLRYRYTRANGQLVDLSRAQVFHVPGLSWDGVKGYSVVRQARETIGLGLATEEHGARFFSNGATTSFALGSPNKLSEDAFRHLSEQVKTEKAGLSNAWTPWILEEGLEPKPFSMPHDDAQWLETRRHQVTDIARWFRLPPHMLMDLERATFSNIEHQALEFVKYTLLPWIVRWEQAIGMQLLGDEWTEAGGELYAKFNVTALERADLETRFKSYAIGRQWGFVNGDRIAELEDWDPFPGGDEYLVPLNMTTVGTDGSITTTTMTSRNGSSAGTEPKE